MAIDVTIPLWVYPILIWTIIWKATAAWKAARKGHLLWFVAFFIINTAGVLPIVYIFFFQNLKISARKGVPSKKGTKVPYSSGKKKGRKVSRKRAKKAPTL